MPKGPARFGPIRSWIMAAMRRSARTAYATMPMRGAKTHTILMILKTTKFMSNCDAGSPVPEPRPGEIVQRRHVLRHLVEQPFDAHKSILARRGENKFM